MEKLNFSGLLSIHYNSEGEDVLFLSSMKAPIADALSYLKRKQVYVQYYISDKQITLKEAREDFIKKIMGIACIEYRLNYSDITGYLYTDENLCIGGHDLLRELKSNVGKWLLLEIEVHN